MTENRVKTIDRALDVLEYVKAHGEAGVVELADSVGVAKSSVHGYLTTLTERGYLRQNAEGKYELTLKALGLGGTGRQRMTRQRSIRQLLQSIAESTGQSVSFATEVDGELMFVDMVRGDAAVETDVHVGWSTPIHTLPEGRLILANLPDGRRSVVLDRITADSSMDETSDSPTGDIEDRHELDGPVTSRGNIKKGVTTVSAPVVTGAETFHGIVMLAAPSDALTEERISEFSEVLRTHLARFKVNASFAD